MNKMKILSWIAISITSLICGCVSPDNYGGHWEYIKDSNSVAFYTTKGNQIGTVSMAKNRKFCRPSQDGKSLAYAPVILPPRTNAPTEEEYNDAGWFRNAVQPPVPPEGKVLESTIYVYDAEENAVVAQYTYADPPPPTLEDYDMAMENFLREEREARGYTTREPDTYLTSHVPRWAQDAKDWVDHRDAVMLYALELINEVAAGTREQPTMEEFLANMPRVVWHYEGE